MCAEAALTVAWVFSYLVGVSKCVMTDEEYLAEGGERAGHQSERGKETRSEVKRGLSEDGS